MAKKRNTHLILAFLLGGLLLSGGFWFPFPAAAMAKVSTLTSPNITNSFTGNLGIIQITGLWMNPGQSDDFLVTVPYGITLQSWQSGQNIDAFVSVSQNNPEGGRNAFYAGPDNDGSVVRNAYASNPQITAGMVSFRLTAAPSSPTFDNLGTVDVTLPVVSAAGAAAGPIKATVFDSDRLIPRSDVGTAILINGGLQIGSNSLPAATVGQSYRTSIDILGGMPPYTFSVSASRLPPGLTLSATDGTLAGTPATAGSYEFQVTVQDLSTATVSQSYTLVVNPAPNAPVFTDIAGSWARSYILELSHAGLVSGFPDGTYRPDESVTRAQFVKMLLAALKHEPAQDTSVLTRFRDYESFQGWERPWLAVAVNEHLLSGYPDGTLRPDQTVSRLEAAVMMGRTIHGVTPTPLTFVDRGNIPSWAANYVELDLTLTKGQDLFGSRPDASFQPYQALTRAGAAAGVAVYLGL